MKKLFILVCLMWTAVIAQGAESSLSFPGAQTGVNIPYDSDFLLFDDVTVEAWIWIDEHSATNRFVFINLIEPDNWGVWLGLGPTNSATGAIVNDGAIRRIEGATVLEEKTWYHIAVVREGTRLEVYLNGTSDGTLTVPNSTLRNAPNALSRIGRAQQDKNPDDINGKIDEVKVWNRALSLDEIRHNMCEKLTGTEPGLVAYYRMDEGTDGTCGGGEDVCDASGNGNHGTKF